MRHLRLLLGTAAQGFHLERAVLSTALMPAVRLRGRRADKLAAEANHCMRQNVLRDMAKAALAKGAPEFVAALLSCPGSGEGDFVVEVCCATPGLLPELFSLRWPSLPIGDMTMIVHSYFQASDTRRSAARDRAR